MVEGLFPATVMPDPDWWQALWPQPGKVLCKLGIGAGMAVVDLCCGDGLFTVPLAGVARRVIAVDLDPQMVDLARARAAAAGVANCVFVVGDAYDLAGFVPEPAGLVLIANTFHGVPDKARLTRAVAAVLKPDGRFVVINWHRRPRDETTVLGQPRGPRTEMRMTPEDVVTAVAPGGLHPRAVIEVPPYHYAAILAKPTT